MLNGSRLLLLMASMPVVTSQCSALVGGGMMPTNSVGHLKVRTYKGFSPVG